MKRNGIQNRKNSWQDGVSGTNCPIPPGWNWTYQFQVKDQIGSFFYFPSLNFQRAIGGFGGIIVNNRDVIPLPFGLPDGDITLFIGDWYSKSLKVSLAKAYITTFCSSTSLFLDDKIFPLEKQKLRREVEDEGKAGAPDGILINGLGPYRYDTDLVPEGIPHEVINVEPGNFLSEIFAGYYLYISGCYDEQSQYSVQASISVSCLSNHFLFILFFHLVAV